MNSIKLFLFLITFTYVGLSQSTNPTGTIKGRLIDDETKLPLVGANIIIINFTFGAATDQDGYFLIESVPSGAYSIQFSYIGYQQKIKTDVIVRPQRITFVNTELKSITLESEAITVSAGYFTKSDDQPVSVAGFSHEEIRRAPGSAGDVSRILMTLPSIAKVNDQSNNLIVRGGNPIENTFYIDNIEISNINHFPQQGASGGPIGILNVDFIEDVKFYSGGFSSIYGDKLSAIMDIDFREGNRQNFETQLDLNFSGFGGIAEGPMFSNKGSWMLSARRSYLDFVVNTFNVGSTVAPVYGDIQGKITYDLNDNNKLIFLGIFADDHNSPGRETAEKNYMTHYGNQDLYQSNFGINWRFLWGKIGYSNTSIAYSQNKYNEDFYETTTAKYAIKNRSLERAIKIRNGNQFILSLKSSLEFGLEGKSLIEEYDNWYNQSTNNVGDTIPALILKDEIAAVKLGGFINFVTNPLNRLTTTLGLRADYFSFNQSMEWSPRFSLSYQLTPETSINSSAGMFYQALPLLLLSQNPNFKDLKNPSAIHYIFGLEHLLSESTKLTLEVYQKDYRNFPMDPKQQAIFVLDKNYFDNYERLLDNGKASSRGIEFMIQKKLAEDFYGLASASWFKSRYQGLNGKWHNRDYDNQITFSIEGGYKPNNNWEFSMRWIYAGGVPYTPFDIEKSKLNHIAVYDKNSVNESRYPDYHSMNLRVDKRWYFSSSNIVFYLSVWNVYDRKNLANYFWNDKEQKPEETYQWGLLPIFGFEYEF